MFEVLRNSRYNDPICQVIMECMCLINNNTRLPRSPEELPVEKYWAFPGTASVLPWTPALGAPGKLGWALKLQEERFRWI